MNGLWTRARTVRSARIWVISPGLDAILAVRCPCVSCTFRSNGKARVDVTFADRFHCIYTACIFFPHLHNLKDRKHQELSNCSIIIHEFSEYLAKTSC